MAQNDFVELLTGARNGDAEALDRLVRLYEADVRLVVRSRLPRSLRSQFDSMDFVQAVWASVLVKESPGGEFADADQFRAYLGGVARNKVLEEYRRRTKTRKYDLAREEPMHVRRGDGRLARELTTADPSPSQEAEAAELLGRLESCDPVVAEIVALRRQGWTFEQIAIRTQRSDRSVRRLLEAARTRLETRG